MIFYLQLKYPTIDTMQNIELYRDGRLLEKQVLIKLAAHITFTCIVNIETFIHLHLHKHTVYQEYRQYKHV